MLTVSAPGLRAQGAEEAWNFIMQMNEISNSINAETAKEAAQKCAAMGEQLKTMKGFADAQRLYLESQVEHCLFYAMNNGNFSDASGDQCSHHLAYAQKLSAAIEGGLKMPGGEGEFMKEMANQLRNAIGMAPQFGCNADYSVFSKTVEAANAAGERTPKEPDFAFMEEIVNTTSAITPETAKDAVAKCSALTGKLMQKPDLLPFEKHYYPALIEGCMATAKEKGAPADINGDACAHLFRRSEQTVAALAEGKRQPGPFDAFLDMLREDLKTTTARASELGCTQPFDQVKEQ